MRWIMQNFDANTPEFQIRRSEIANEFAESTPKNDETHTHKPIYIDRWWCYFIKNMVNRCHLYMNQHIFLSLRLKWFLHFSQLFTNCYRWKCASVFVVKINIPSNLRKIRISMFKLLTLLDFILWYTGLSSGLVNANIFQQNFIVSTFRSVFKEYSSISECN